MRKAQKQQLEELAGQMEEAHSQIKKDMEQGNFPSAMGLLEDCQNGGISMGTLIEATEGEGHPTVKLLEEYCELVYRIYGELERMLKDRENPGGREWNAGKVHKLLRHKLLKISNSINNDIPVRKEAVFLPYKASMWDSMESVWKAADADGNCDAYVIPIPYYDRNADGSFGEMHYEGNQYPDYVPVTYYGAYDFGARMPDIIFIHNPYDQYNFVTSVAPFFYSENLKKFTDMLVYIPYFVLGEIKPEDTDAVEGIKHFCTSPGVFHADRVIVQSEDMKQVYIKVLTDATNDHGEAAKKYWNGKILGLGSPKLDKVLDTDRDSLTVPEDWLDIIKKPDGSRKKVVFYNTSVGALLQYNEKMLEKMRHVFRIFRENKEEVALLWRPHPLVKATVSSMRPQLWAEYEGLVREYLEEGWGIYDDTADVDRAIVLSDAYYGDGSSVVQLYRQTGKPVMIQNADCMEAAWNALHTTYKLVEGQGKTWFFAAFFNGLFTVDLKSGEVEWKGKIAGENDETRHLYRFYLMRDGKLYFAPTNAKRIAVYDVVRNECQTYALDMEGYKKNGNYASVVSYQNDLIFIGVCRTNRICRFCIRTGEITDIGTEVLKRTEVGEFEELYGRETCIRENILYIPLLKGGNALRINLRTGDGELIKLAEEDDVSFSMAICMQSNDTVWFVGNKGYIVQWNEREKKKDMIRFAGPITEKFIAYKLEENKLYLFSVSCGGSGRCIDIPDGKSTKTFQNAFRVWGVEKIGGTDFYLGDTLNHQCCIGYLDADGKEKTNVIHGSDDKIGKACLDGYQIDSSLCNHWSHSAEGDSICMEGDKYSFGKTLETYLGWVKDGFAPYAGKSGRNMETGKKIWNCL